MLPVLPLLVGGALGTVVGFSLKKYFDENQSDIFERIENDTKNLIDRMDFSKLVHPPEQFGQPADLHPDTLPELIRTASRFIFGQF